MDIRIVNKSTNPNPTYGTKGSAACDLQANLPAKEVREYAGKPLTQGFDIVSIDDKFDAIRLFPGGRCAIPTGIHIEIPETYHADIRARSGLAVNHGIQVLNGTGLIDCDYTGEIMVILHNTDRCRAFEITHGMKIAQMLIAKTNKIAWVPVKGLKQTERGDGGFGSTDKETKQ